MSSDSLSRTLSMVAQGGNSLVTFVCEIAVLVAIATVVRRHRPDAYRALLSWAIASLASYIVAWVARAIVPYAANHEIDNLLRMGALLTAFNAALHIVLVILLIRGLVAIAQPPKVIPTEGLPPYR